MRQHVKRERKLPRKVWFHAHRNGEVWFADAFFSRKAARKGLRKSQTFDPRGRSMSLKKAGWRVVGPFVRS